MSPASVADPARHRAEIYPPAMSLAVVTQIVQPCPKAEPSGQPREPMRHRVWVHGLSASRVEREHVRVVGEPHAAGLRPLCAATPMLIQELHAVLGERQPASSVGLGVLLHQAPGGLEQVAEDQELGRLRSMLPHRSAHSSPRRAPVVAASHSSTAKSGSASYAVARSRETSSGVGGRIWPSRVEVGWPGPPGWRESSPSGPPGPAPGAGSHGPDGRWLAPSACRRRRRGHATPSRSSLAWRCRDAAVAGCRASAGWCARCSPCR